jgi:predicted metal-dependent hydrolase
MFRYEAKNIFEEGLLKLTEVIGNTIIEKYPKPVNSDMAGIKVSGNITIRFLENKRRASFCTPWLRAVTYTSRDVNKCNTVDDLVELAVHECCHFAYIGHNKAYWKEYNYRLQIAREWINGLQEN